MTNNNAPGISVGDGAGYSHVFNGSNQDEEIAATAVLTTFPMTLEAWINPTNATAQQAILVLSDGDTGAAYFVLEAAGHIAGDPIRGQKQASGQSPEVFAASTIGYGLSYWQHACMTCTSATLVAAYCRGGGYGESTTNSTPASIARTMIAAFRVTTSYFSPYTGRIADAIIRNVVLSPTEVMERSDPGKRYAIYHPLGRTTYGFVVAAPPGGNRRRRVLMGAL